MSNESLEQRFARIYADQFEETILNGCTGGLHGDVIEGMINLDRNIGDNDIQSFIRFQDGDNDFHSYFSSYDVDYLINNPKLVGSALYNELIELDKDPNYRSWYYDNDEDDIEELKKFPAYFMESLKNYCS